MHGHVAFSDTTRNEGDVPSPTSTVLLVVGVVGGVAVVGVGVGVVAVLILKRKR